MCVVNSTIGLKYTTHFQGKQMSYWGWNPLCETNSGGRCSRQLWWPFSFFIANQILAKLGKNKDSCLISMYILIRTPNQALSDVTQFKKKKILTFVITEHNMPQWWGTEFWGSRNDSFQKSVSHGVFSGNRRVH